MRWIVLCLFVLGLIFVGMGCWDARKDAEESADVAMGDEFLKAMGYGFWLLDIAVVVVWGLVRLFF